jgi:hypothetical protein
MLSVDELCRGGSLGGSEGGKDPNVKVTTPNSGNGKHHPVSSFAVIRDLFKENEIGDQGPQGGERIILPRSIIKIAEMAVEGHRSTTRSLSRRLEYYCKASKLG